MAELIPTDPRYGEALLFLYHEAELLDSGRQVEWLDLLAEDVSYRMPVQLTLKRGASAPYSSGSDIFSDNLASLRVRVHKLDTEYAWAETPASRTRHHVSNVRVSEGDKADELRVSSNLLVYRTRPDNPVPDILSGERQDVLRKVGSAWRLAARTICLDQSVVGASHLGILL